MSYKASVRFTNLFLFFFLLFRLRHIRKQFLVHFDLFFRFRQRRDQSCAVLSGAGKACILVDSIGIFFFFIRHCLSFFLFWIFLQSETCRLQGCIFKHALVQRLPNNRHIHLPAFRIAQDKNTQRSPLCLRFLSSTLEKAFCANVAVI